MSVFHGRVSWFSLERKYGFVALDGNEGDAFLHLSALKALGYVSVPAGTSVLALVELVRGKPRVMEVLRIDTDTAHPGEPPPVMSKRARKPEG
jgi:CspA family cold shock protein